MRKPIVLITGASGEIGHGLIEHYRERGDHAIVALDLKPLPDELAASCERVIAGDILDRDLMQQLVAEYAIHEIHHLAALLSTRSEFSPHLAHQVNVEGTLNLLELACEQAQWHGNPVRFLFPSSIAAYGFPDRKTKMAAGKVSEHEWNEPTTMYGCNKLYCEHLGRYYTEHFRQLAAEEHTSGVDFRAIRFPGLISAVSQPSGGTSDFGPGMLHAGARGEAYSAFVDAEAQIPFMAMPDAIKALIDLASADPVKLTQRVYNVSSFSMTAGRIRERVINAFPLTDITFQPDVARTRIVDSWPADVDDSPARRDWGWSPDYAEAEAFDDYLIPTISRFYKELQ